MAAVAWSTAGILQRELTMDTATQVAGRALFATLTLFAYHVVTQRGRVVPAFRSIGRDGVAVAACMAIASGTFIVALNYTTVARVLFIQAAAPVAAALLARAFLGEPITTRTWVAMLVAMSGVGLMIGTPSGGDLKGDLLALVMMFSFAIAIVITRRRRDISMAPATCLAQLMLLVVSAPFASFSQIGPRDLLLLIALGAFQMGLGLVLFTVGARLLPASEVAMITLLEVVLGPLWVWIALSEKPDTATVVGGVIVIAAVVVQATGPRQAAILDTSPAAGP